MEAMLSNPVIFYLVAGLIIIGFDIFMIGLSPLVFLGIGAVLTSGILYYGGYSLTMLEALALCAVVSLLLALVGYGPLRRFQNSNVRDDDSSDLIGRELVTTQEVTKAGGSVDWSGTQWQARLADDVQAEKIGAGVRARIVKVVNAALVLRPI